VIHVWAYDSFEERTRSAPRRGSSRAGRPNVREFVTEQQSKIFLPAPFSPKLEPRQLGNLYETPAVVSVKWRRLSCSS